MNEENECMNRKEDKERRARYRRKSTLLSSFKKGMENVQKVKHRAALDFWLGCLAYFMELDDYLQPLTYEIEEMWVS